MANNQTYRAFVARPSRVLDLDGELLDGTRVLADLASEVRDISAYATTPGSIMAGLHYLSSE